MAAPRKLSNEKWLEISLSLDNHHAVFYKLWEMGKPVFITELGGRPLETAAVQFDSKGEFVWFFFNPDFWDSIDDETRKFVICHECLHVILNHGSRTTDGGSANGNAINAALDVVVNHALINYFDFNREDIINWEKYCWVDTTFKDKQAPDNECFEYYYNLFDKIYSNCGGGDRGGNGEGNGGKTVDDHSHMGDAKDVIEKLNESMTAEEKKSLKDLIEKHNKDKDKKAGNGCGGWTFVNAEVKKKKKWETVIKRWSSQYWVVKEVEIEQWAMEDRRTTLLDKSMMLPSLYEDEQLARGKFKVDVWFFLDTSGSCWGLKDRFFEAALSLDKHRFNVRLFCFDTRVEETTLESRKVYGGGGTAFDILEERIRLEKQQNESFDYPEGVFVITDGYGNRINTQYPDRWHWFLSEGGTKECIDKGANIYWLKDFE